MTTQHEEDRALIDHALEIAAKGVQINDGHTYRVPAQDLVDYAETLRALVEVLRRPRSVAVEDREEVLEACGVAILAFDAYGHRRIAIPEQTVLGGPAIEAAKA